MNNCGNTKGAAEADVSSRMFGRLPQQLLHQLTRALSIYQIPSDQERQHLAQTLLSSPQMDWYRYFVKLNLGETVFHLRAFLHYKTGSKVKFLLIFPKYNKQAPHKHITQLLLNRDEAELQPACSAVCCNIVRQQCTVTGRLQCSVPHTALKILSGYTGVAKHSSELVFQILCLAQLTMCVSSTTCLCARLTYPILPHSKLDALIITTSLKYRNVTPNCISVCFTSG